MPLKIALAAGEASGDNLGAALIGALREHVPDAHFFGIAGERMREAGCEAWHRSEELSVMGLAEVLPHLPRLLRMRRRFIERAIAARPDVFIGIDSSDFNLPIAAAMKAAGIPAVQYVSPQVWAWRSSRVSKIRAATDLVLCLLPFETGFYAEHGVNARFVGHPLADVIPFVVERAGARAALGLDASAPLIAILPGSRRSEVTRLSRPFLESAKWLKARRPELRFAVALANESVGSVCRAAAVELAFEQDVDFVTGRAREVMAAADAVLTASGTASLEAMLLKRPMIVAHRLSRLTYWLAQSMGIARLPNFSLPNLLAGRTLVPEYVQSEVRADILGPALLRCLDGQALDPAWHAEFSDIHRELRQGASSSAAQAILDLVQSHRETGSTLPR
jgi:lipid-A-disaccharide synthase